MRIAIVGAGFYGCYISRAIHKEWGDDASVDVFERESRPMRRAATNNQARLHLGFHYPRSPETVRQTVEGYHDFKKEFAQCVDFPSQNIYAVHREGLVGFDCYLKAMDAFSLPYQICGEEVRRYFRDPSEVEGAIRVDEGVIDLRKLDAMILASMRTDIRCSTRVESIDSEAGTLVANGSLEGPYDFIINTTYVDPNLGLSVSNHFDLKYEIAAMIEMEAPFGQDVALTIMDGPFVSLYPCGQALATLSSVVHTPFMRFDTVEEFEALWPDAEMHANQAGVFDKILKHGEEMLSIDRGFLRCRRLLLAPKAKLREDVDASRISSVRKQGRLISVLCGKLDAVHAVANEVRALLPIASRVI